MNRIKAQLYKTARSQIGCAKFKADEFVAIEYSHTSDTGVHWFFITETQNGKLDTPVAYPEHHLYQFCL